MAWKEDGQYEGRRLWINAKEQGAYTFPEFVEYVKQNETRLAPFYETGLQAAKLMWAISPPAEPSEDERLAASKFGEAVSKRRCCSHSRWNNRAFTFSETLAYTEVCGLRQPKGTDIETARSIWNLMF